MRQFKLKIVLYATFSLICTLSFGQNFYEQGKNKYLAGAMDSSIILLTKAIEINQETAKSYMYRGAAKSFSKDYIGAFSDLTKSEELDSTNYKTYLYFGRAYAMQGFNKIAIKYYNLALIKKPDGADIYDSRAIAKEKEGDRIGAISDENIAIQIDSTKSTYFSNRGFFKAQNKQYKEAIADYNKTIELGGNNQVYSNKGSAYEAIGMHKEAIECFTIAIEKKINVLDFYNVYYLRGLSYKSWGKMDEACADFSKSAEMGSSLAASEFKKSCAK